VLNLAIKLLDTKKQSQQEKKYKYYFIIIHVIIFYFWKIMCGFIITFLETVTRVIYLPKLHIAKKDKIVNKK
jgi:hypothetical protein